MLIVLHGDSLLVYVTALSILERYSRIGVQVLILEDPLSSTLNKFSSGPLPWCVVSLENDSNKDKRFLRHAAYNRSESSVMFLETIQWARSSKRSLDMPSTSSVNIKLSPHETNIITYQPQILQTFLKRLLLSHKSCSFAAWKDGSRNVQSVLRQFIDGYYYSDGIVIQLKNSTPVRKLEKFQLSYVNWLGVKDWRLPTHVFINHKKHNSHIQLRSKQMASYIDVMSSYTNFDLGGSFVAANCVLERLELYLHNKSDLRWSRL